MIDPTKVNHHGFVDLGLSVKWASVNRGAEKPVETGNYYIWGNIYQMKGYTERKKIRPVNHPNPGR